MLPAIRARTVGDPRRELIEVMRAILDVIDRYREAFNVLHHEARYLERRPQYRTAMKKIGDDYLGAVAEIIERGRRTGVINSKIRAAPCTRFTCSAPDGRWARTI